MITLHLTGDEARFLWRLLGRHIVGENGEMRKLNSSIFDRIDRHFDPHGNLSEKCAPLPVELSPDVKLRTDLTPGNVLWLKED